MLDHFEKKNRNRAGERYQTLDDRELSQRREGVGSNEEQREGVDRMSKQSRSPRDDDEEAHPAKRKINVNIHPPLDRTRCCQCQHFIMITVSQTNPVCSR